MFLTDPPYGVNYRDRDGRTVKNDNTLDNVLPVFAEAFRALKPGSLCVSFYGWNRIDRFMEAWKEAGFSVVGHIVWTKKYASRARILAYHHEQAYVLAKGTARKPQHPLKDVQEFVYTGNKAHPTEKAVESLSPVIKAFSRPGEIVCEPFAGSGSTCVAAALCGRQYLGIELEQRYCDLANKRLVGAKRYANSRNKRAA